VFSIKARAKPQPDQRLKLTGATILVFTAPTSLQAAPATWTWRSAAPPPAVAESSGGRGGTREFRGLRARLNFPLPWTGRAATGG
jgi:hypothetical protein